MYTKNEFSVAIWPSAAARFCIDGGNGAAPWKYPEKTPPMANCCHGTARRAWQLTNMEYSCEVVMLHEYQRPILTTGNDSLAALFIGNPETARRKSGLRDRSARYPDTVELAKQPGLLYRLRAALND